MSPVLSFMWCGLLNGDRKKYLSYSRICDKHKTTRLEFAIKLAEVPMLAFYTDWTSMMEFTVLGHNEEIHVSYLLEIVVSATTLRENSIIYNNPTQNKIPRSS